MIYSIYSEPFTLGSANPKIDLPINQWWGIQAGQGADASWQSSYERMVDRFLDLFPQQFGSSKRLTADEANESYGIKGQLQFDKDVDERDAIWMHESTRKRIFQEELVNNAQHQAGLFRGITGFGAQVAGGMFNSRGFANIDMGLSLIPTFGVTSKATQAARAAGYAAPGTFAVRQGLREIGERGGLIGLDAAKLGPLGKVPLFTESVLQGTSAAAIGELTTYFDAVYRDAETQYLAGVLTEGATSGAFHAFMRGIGKVAIKSAELLKVITPESRDLAEAKSVYRAITGDDSVDPTNHLRADEGVLEATAKAKRAEADEQLAAETRLVTRQEADPLEIGPAETLYLVQTEATRQAGTPNGKVFERLLDRFFQGERTIGLFEQMARLLDRSYNPEIKNAQDGFFAERVFGGERAKAIAEAKKSLKQVGAEIVKLENARTELFRLIKDAEGTAEISRIEGEIEAASDAKTRINKALRKAVADGNVKKQQELEASLQRANERIAQFEQQLKQEREFRVSKITKLKQNEYNLSRQVDELYTARQKFEQELIKPSPLSDAEINDHLAQRRVDLEQRIQPEREAAVRSIAEAEDPKAQAKKEVEHAAKVVKELSKQIDTPRSKPFADASGDKAKELQLENDVNNELLADIKDTIKRLEDASKPEAGRPQTALQKELSARAAQMQKLFDEIQSQSETISLPVNQEYEQVMSVLNCMVIRGVE